MSSVIVKHQVNENRINVIHLWGKYVITQLYFSYTDSNHIYTYLVFDQLHAENENDLIDKFYLTRDIINRNNAGFIIGKIDSEESKGVYKSLFLQIDAEETGTEGSKSYVVCLACGGEMGAPDYRYSNFQIIKAGSEEEAVYKYNDINDCIYFKGYCIGEIITEGDKE